VDPLTPPNPVDSPEEEDPEAPPNPIRPPEVILLAYLLKGNPNLLIHYSEYTVTGVRVTLLIGPRKAWAAFEFYLPYSLVTNVLKAEDPNV